MEAEGERRRSAVREGERESITHLFFHQIASFITAVREFVRKRERKNVPENEKDLLIM